VAAAPIDPGVYDATAGLPEHDRVLRATLEFFHGADGALGAWVSGSVARGGMDEHSDLDVGVVMTDLGRLEQVWADRWDWDIAPWFHRFDADHVKPYFVIYLFEPGVKTDISLSLPDEPLWAEGAPYRVAWDDDGRVAEAVTAAGDRPPPVPPRHERAVHEDERFWAWTYYCLGHARRGEYYSVASDIAALRGIVETWHARVAEGTEEFSVRRVEQRAPADVVATLADGFPSPDRASIRHALLRLIELHDAQRAAYPLPPGLAWRTSDDASKRIRSMIAEL
jgi:predicted nucleotidyltransferase